MVTAKGTYMTPMLIDQIGYLSSMLSGADQKPGQDAYRRLEVLDARLKACIEELKRLPKEGYLL